MSHVAHSCCRLFFTFFFLGVNWLLSDFYICISWAKKLLPLLYYHVMSGTKKHATHKQFLCFFSFFLLLLFFYHSLWTDENSWVEYRGDLVIFFFLYVVEFYFRFSYASSASVSVISSAVFSSCLTRRTTVYWLCRQHPRDEQLGTASQLGDKATKSHRNPLTVLKRAKPPTKSESMKDSLSLARFALSASLQSADGDEGFNCRCYWPSNRFSSLFVVAAAKSKNNNKNMGKRGLSYFFNTLQMVNGQKVSD